MGRTGLGVLPLADAPGNGGNLWRQTFAHPHANEKIPATIAVAPTARHPVTLATTTRANVAPMPPIAHAVPEARSGIVMTFEDRQDEAGWLVLLDGSLGRENAPSESFGAVVGRDDLGAHLGLAGREPAPPFETAIGNLLRTILVHRLVGCR